MAVEGGMKCIKFMIIFLNLIFVVVGIALMTVGALVATKFKSYIDVMGANYSGTPIVISVAGVVIFLIAFFGCCGSLKESYCMVSTYAFLLILALILQIGGGIASFVLHGKVENAVQDAWKHSLPNYNETKFHDFIDLVQRNLKCCGGSNYTDWRSFYHSAQVPKSCCKKNETHCNNLTPTKFDIYQDGCVPKLRDFMKGNIGIVAGVALAVCFVQIIGIIMACCLSQILKKIEYECV